MWHVNYRDLLTPSRCGSILAAHARRGAVPGKTLHSFRGTPPRSPLIVGKASWTLGLSGDRSAASSPPGSVPRLLPRGYLVAATGKEGGERHGKIHPDLCVLCHGSTAIQLAFSFLILQVGAVQLQLLSDRGVAGDLHMHLHQDAVPGHPQRPHRVFFFLPSLAHQITKNLGYSILCAVMPDCSVFSPYCGK